MDLSPAGAQPISDEAGEWVLAFNGEIYNHRSLRQRCEARGHRFASSMDGEVILHLWEEEGVRALDRLNGIYALVVANTRTGEVILARDPLGVKPVFYCEGRDGSLWFASEIAALRRAGAPVGSHDVTALAQFLTFLWVPDPRTPFVGVRSLMPGHALRWAPGQPTVTFPTAELMDVRPRQIPSDLREAAARFTEEMVSAVGRQFLGDVPIGLMASGGVDSSLIWWAGRGKLRRGYTVAWRRDRHGENLDEDASAVAYLQRQFGTDIAYIKGEEMSPSPLPSSGDLFADPAYGLTRLIASRARRDDIKVLMSGQGADELFAGYRRHTIAGLLQHLHLGTLGKSIGSMLGGLGSRRVELEYLVRTVRASQHIDPFDRYMELCSYSNSLDRARILGCTEREVSNSVVWGRHREVFDRQPPSTTFARRLLAVDTAVYLPGLGLAYVDRAGMEFGVEIRVPWLDVELVRWAATVPDGLLFGGRRRKLIPRTAVRDLLGSQIADRPKRGFAAPAAYLNAASETEARGVRQPMYLRKAVATLEAFRQSA